MSLWALSCLVVLVWTCSFSSASVHKLELNPESALFQDVEAISHETEDGRVTIHFKSTGKCAKPTFAIRLVGASLYILDLDDKESADTSLSYTYPQIVDNGNYYIEVVLLYCGAVELSKYKQTCHEKVENSANVVNLPYAFEVQGVLPNVCGDKCLPRWVFQPWEAPNLPTNHQSSECGGDTKCGSENKISPQFSWYEFMEGPLSLDAFTNVSALINTTEPITLNVCFVGSSHAKLLSAPEKTHHFDPHNNINYFHIESQRPTDFNLTHVDQRHCSYVVFGWEDSFRGQEIPSAEEFATELRAVLKTVTRPAYQGPVQFFLRSLHPSGLSAQVTSCPPTDLLNPVVTPLLNAMLRAVAKEFDIAFIDTSHVLKPLWNTQLDWLHYSTKAYSIVAQVIAQQCLESSIRRSLAPRIDPGFVVLPVDTLIRFQDDKVVHLYRDGELHPFSNGRVFARMGFDFVNVVVMHPSKRRYAKNIYGSTLN